MFKKIFNFKTISGLYKIARYNELCKIKPINNIQKLYYSSPLLADENKIPNDFQTTENIAESTTVNIDEASLLERKLKILKLEVSVLRQEGRKVPDPDSLSQFHWDHLLTLNSKSARGKYYTFLWQLEMKKENQRIKKDMRKEQGVILREEKLIEYENNNHIIYSLQHTSLLLRIYDSTQNHWHNNKLSRAMQFGQKLILDCSYDQHMIPREAINAAKQLMFSFAENRLHNDPFDLYFCNANMKGVTMQYLQRHIPTMMEPDFPMNIHEGSFLDLFPKEQLVYLTPHCKTDLTEFNPDHIYIIGAMVDKINNEPLSLAKAKRQGIKMARLPLDQYLQWGGGSGKSLTLNQMTSILLDLKTTGDWNTALSHVPRRKIANEFYEQNLQQKQWNSNVNKYKFITSKANSWLDENDNEQSNKNTSDQSVINKFSKKNTNTNRRSYTARSSFKIPEF